MTSAPLCKTTEDADPLVVTWLIALGFFCLGLTGIDHHSVTVFDEAYYVPAAKHLLLGDIVINREHPPLGKELIAVGILLFGDNPFGWRIAALCAGTLGLVCWSRAMWWHTRSRAATMLFTVLIATNFLLFALSQLAMLDTFLFAFTGAAITAFLRGLDQPRWMMACGINLGLALACKWTAAPIALAMALWYFRLTWRQPLHAVVCFGVLPTVVYFATFAPYLTTRQLPLEFADLPALQIAMVQRLTLFLGENPLTSEWWEWLLNTGHIVIARETDGFMKIVVVGGNPVTMPAVAPAVGLALLAGRRFVSATLPAAMFCLTLVFWMISQKPDQYQFYYLLPSTFGMAVLAIVLASWRKLAWLVSGAGFLTFAWFFPVLTGAKIPTSGGLARYDWLPGWEIPPKPGKQPQKRNTVLEAADGCLDKPSRCYEQRDGVVSSLSGLQRGKSR